MLAHHRDSDFTAGIREFDESIVVKDDEPVSFESSNCLRYRRHRLLQSFRKSRTECGLPLLLQFKDNLEIHLGCVDQIGHSTSSDKNTAPVDNSCREVIVSGEVSLMSQSHHHHRLTVLSEIAALILATVGITSLGSTPSATASTEQPAVAYSVAAPNGVTIDSPWITDATGNTAWALGVNASGVGVLARRDLASATITTTTTLAGEIGASEGKLVPSNGNILFLAKRPGGGYKTVYVNPTTGLRLTGFDLPASEINPKGIGHTANGSSAYFGSNQSTSGISRQSLSTGAISSTAPIVGTPITSGVWWSSKLMVTTGGPNVTIVGGKDGLPVTLDTASPLPGISQNLVDPAVAGNVGWYGTDSSPLRLVGVDFVTRTVVSNFSATTTGNGLRNILITGGGTLAYATTVDAGHTKLVAIRLLDGATVGVTDLGALTGATSISVSGRFVDVAFSGSTALVRTTTAAPPTTPTGVTVVESDGELNVTWNAVTSEEPVVTYRVAASGTNTDCTTVSTSCRLTGLDNGVDYGVTVSATSYAGTTTSDIVIASPVTRPSNPTDVTAMRGDQSVTVNWVPGANGGRPITRYIVTLEPGGHTCISETNACTLTGLTNGTSYSATVVAETIFGRSPSSDASNVVTAANVPDAPSRPIAVRGDRQVEVSWTAPNNQGEAIAGYRVLLDDLEVCWTTELTCTVSELTNGVALAFSVVAFNAVGSSDPSVPSEPVTPASAPDSPESLVAVSDVDAVAVTWQPAFDGGEALTGYRVSVWNEAELVTSVDTTELTAVVTGLSYPTEYRITVEAMNVMGSSPRATVWAAPLAHPPVVEPPVVDPPITDPPVIPEPPTVPVEPTPTAPSSPGHITLSKVTAKTYTLTWATPANGGSPILDYRIAKRITGARAFSVIRDSVSSRRTATIPRPANGKAVYVRIVTVNAIGQSTPPAVVKLKGKKIYAMPSVAAVRFSDAAAFFGSDARSTPYDGTSFANGFAHSSFL